MDEVTTNLPELRRKRAISAIQLAEAAGVKRQTIYAMEAGTYVPNTAVALRLARALDTTVEELFSLAAPETPVQQATTLPGSAALKDGQSVQLCQVDSQLVAYAPSPLPWYLPAADAVVSGSGRVQTFQTGSDFSNRILVAGCDPAISVLSRHVRPTGIELVLAHRNSSQALDLLRQGCIHIAGTHFESNVAEIERIFGKNSVAVISFAVWEEGIVTAAGNPKSIRGVDDFARADVSIVNRERGAGSRALLDARLKKVGMRSREVRGYDTFAAGHLPAAWQVQSGTVDCCLATRAAARAFGLNFIPLASERYDLVIRKRHLELPRIQNLLDTLSRSDFRRELEGLGGYDAKSAGERVL